MLVEIRGAGFVNKGAELMLLAAVDALENRFENVQFAIRATGENSAAPYFSRAGAGFFQKAHLPLRGHDFGRLFALVPKKLREAYGVILNSEIDVVLDISGFAYGDQWGGGPAKRLLYEARRWKENGTRVYLLPQAFGPFEQRAKRKAAKKAFEYCDVIYAREPVSLEHLRGLSLRRPRIELAPDFTNLLIAPRGLVARKLKNRFCMIPNAKMIEKTDSLVSKRYLDFLKTLYEVAYAEGYNPFILLHETNDLRLAEKLSNLVPDIEVHAEPDPLVIKAIIGASYMVFSSRFHGLASALSQAVPAIGTAWSHKYKMLFADYDFPDGLVDIVSADRNFLRAKLRHIGGSAQNEVVRKTLRIRSSILKKAANNMWDDVAESIQSSR